MGLPTTANYIVVSTLNRYPRLCLRYPHRDFAFHVCV
ncbi:Uncharacterised protein [Vibrio cholerae]|nr:Uncharacterised protein [Vibrio cholerae]